MARSLPLAEGWYVYLSILVGLPYLPLEHYSLSSAFVAWIDGWTDGWIGACRRICLETIHPG